MVRKGVAAGPALGRARCCHASCARRHGRQRWQEACNSKEAALSWVTLAASRRRLTCRSSDSICASSVVARNTKNCSTTGSVLTALAPSVLRAGTRGGRLGWGPLFAAEGAVSFWRAQLLSQTGWETQTGHEEAQAGADGGCTCCRWARGASPAPRAPGWPPPCAPPPWLPRTAPDPEAGTPCPLRSRPAGRAGWQRDEGGWAGALGGVIADRRQAWGAPLPAQVDRSQLRAQRA